MAASESTPRSPLVSMSAVLALALTSCGLAAQTGADQGTPSFTQPAACDTGGASATTATRRNLAGEGIDGVFVVAESNPVDLAVEECPAYETFPPAAGSMAPTWANCGFYDSPVSPPHAVHSLRNGAVWIVYDPGLDSEEISVIRNAATTSSHILASPADGLESAIVLIGWQRQLWIDDAQDTRFDEFINAYLYSPDRPTIYAPCRDGQGKPKASFWDKLG